MNKLINTSITRTVEKLQKPLLPIKGAIFDLDGVLTDSSELHFLAWKRLTEEENISFSREDNEALRGIPRRESLLLIFKTRELSDLQIQEMMERKNQYYVDSISTITEQDLLPGARDFLIDLRSAGIKTAVGSSSKNARTLIEKLGISVLFDAIADGSIVNNQKPAPDLFLHAAKLIHVQPSKCVVFEDATAGIEAAIAGGMWAIGIGPQKRLKMAHVIFNNLEGLSVKKMNELLTRVTNL